VYLRQVVRGKSSFKANANRQVFPNANKQTASTSNPPTTKQFVLTVSPFGSVTSVLSLALHWKVPS